MAHIKGKKDISELGCIGCKQTIEFEAIDLRHYAHDVDGNHVYISCPSCFQRNPCSDIAIQKGWVPSGD